MLKRRTLLKSIGFLPLVIGGLPGLSLAAAATDKRFLLIQLRGGMDGLAAVPPVGDPDFKSLRETTIPAAPLDLNGAFALHPALGHFHKLYAEGDLIVFHAIATPYRDRSHFDAQDVMENGTLQPHGARDGWLNRAIGVASPETEEAMAISLGQTVPLVLRGPASVTSWAPSQLPEPSTDLLDRLADLYAGDRILGPALARALEVDELSGAGRSHRLPNKERFEAMMKAAANFLSGDSGPNIAVVDSNGWDTHANQGADNGVLAAKLAELDNGLAAFKEAVGGVWRDTVIVVLTEFGRTVHENGTRGTDHGTASAAFLAGGAVKGGRVIADWPGLERRFLHEGRDLTPTLDTRSVLKGVIRDLFDLSADETDRFVFPDSAGIQPISGLVAV